MASNILRHAYSYLSDTWCLYHTGTFRIHPRISGLAFRVRVRVRVVGRGN